MITQATAQAQIIMKLYQVLHVMVPNPFQVVTIPGYKYIIKQIK